MIGAHGITSDGEGREVIEMLAELPDLWDVNLSYVENDSWSARFSDEGFQEPFVAFVKQVTSKPVVGVGRFTSPDAMVSQIRRGILDIIGAARPSIADPFLPAKIDEGREDEIRECIGCNMCRAANNEDVPIRCTQNPTMGEEWRRGWHPERVPPKGSAARVLVVGAGPSGLECAMTLGKRGYDVVLAEATTRLGGRVTRESRLPGLSSWARVRDYREGQIQRLPNVEVYLDSRLSAKQVLEFGFDQVILATGARWRRDGIGYHNEAPVPGADRPGILTPDDLLDGASPAALPKGAPVVIYDDEHYFMGGALAEKLARDGHKVTVVTPSVEVSSWTKMTDEQARVQKALIELGVTLVLTRRLVAVEDGAIAVACIYSGRASRIAFGRLVLVGARQPDDALYHELMRDPAALADAGIRAVTRIGDCYAPASVMHAVYSGHRIARELDAAPDVDAVPYRRERVVSR